MTPTITTLDRWSESLEPNSIPNSSPTPRRENSAPRNIYDLASQTKMNSPLPLRKKSWLEYEGSSQTSRRRQCNLVHYHLYCERCQTLVGWEPHQLTKPTSGTLMMSFGKLKEYCESLPVWGKTQPQEPKKVSLQWREEQFARAVYKRNAVKVAQEAQRRQVCRQRGDPGVTPPVSGTGTQMSTHS